MDSLKISVSMCVYGGDNPQCFEIALESIISQTYKPSEIVLVVDGEVPKEINDVIEKYVSELNDSETTFKVIRLEKNVGHGEARRICLNNCSFDVVALMDADDISVPYRFEKQASYFRKYPELSIVGGNISEFISQENPKDVSQMAGRRLVPETDEEIRKFMRKRCPMNQVTVMFKKKDVEEVGGYLDWYCEEDYYLWIRMALAGKKFGNLPENLVNVRVGEEMYRRRGGIKYFASELKLQYFMYKMKIISLSRFFINTVERLILQVLTPNCIRGLIFQRLARN